MSKIKSSTHTKYARYEMLENAHVLTAIDPSTNSMGYATFVNGRLAYYGTVVASRDDRKEVIAQRVHEIVSELALRLPASGYKQTVIIEEPEVFSGARGSAAVHDGSLKKLILTVGAVIWHCFLIKADTKLIPIVVWKGQLPKFVTKERMEKKYKTTFKTDDEADAVALGDWYLTEGIKG